MSPPPVDPKFLRAAIMDVRRQLLKNAIKRVLERTLQLVRFSRADP